MDEEILEPSGPEPEIDRETLEARLAAAEAENRLYRLAPEMGVSPAAVPYLARLCPVREADGEAQTRAALEKRLAERLLDHIVEKEKNENAPSQDGNA